MVEVAVQPEIFTAQGIFHGGAAGGVGNEDGRGAGVDHILDQPEVGLGTLGGLDHEGRDG